MKKTLLVIFVLFLSLFTACKTQVAGPGPTAVPPWLNDAPPQEAIWGIGTAKQSSTSMSMTTAEARARVSIARQITTKVQSMFVDYNEDAGNINNQANASLQQDVSRQVTNIDVSGARPIQRWQAPDGTWWFLVEANKADIRNSVASMLNNQEAQYAQFRAQQALQYLDYQLNNNTQPIVVSE